MQRRHRFDFASNSDESSNDSGDEQWNGSDDDSDSYGVTNDDDDDVILYDIEYSSYKRKYDTTANSINGQKLFVSNDLIEKILNLGKIVGLNWPTHAKKGKNEPMFLRKEGYLLFGNHVSKFSVSCWNPYNK